MVMDFARSREFDLVEKHLFAYGMWLERRDDAWSKLGVPGPTNRTFSTA